DFGLPMTGAPAAGPAGGASEGRPVPVGWLIALVIFLLLVTRGRILWLPFWLGGFGSGRGGWSGGGGSGGGGGFGGGGFGGFGGGGGFLGGVAGGRFSAKAHR